MSQILLVDDDAPFRTMLRRVLERAGHEVREAAGGRIAVEMYEQQPSDVVITDLVMPEQEGIETILQLRRSHPDVRIVAISGGGRFDPKLTLEMAGRLGASRTLAKPFTRSEILAAVEQALTCAGESPGPA